MSAVINLNPTTLPFYMVTNLQCAPEGPRSVPVTLRFDTASVYTITLQNLQARQYISMIQAVFVDNSGGASPVTVYNAQTNQTLSFGAGKQGYLNVLCPNPAQLTFSSANGIATPIELLNFPVTNHVWSAA